MSIAMDMAKRGDRIDVDEYYRMAQVGLLAPDARVELIDGVIVDMPPIGSRHAEVVRRLTALLFHAVGERATVSCQQPVRLNNWSEPQPDLAVLRSRSGGYGRRHPLPEDVLLMIEVSDTSLRFDCDAKGALYARHEVPEFWLVDINARKMHVFRSPSKGTYGNVLVPGMDGVDITGLSGATLDLSALFSDL